MDKILLISSAAFGFVFGAVYAAVTKMLVQAAKAIISANQKIDQSDRATAKKNGQERDGKPQHRASEKAKLPARVK